MLSDKEKIRYSRQMMLQDIGETGQLKLKNSRVLIVGVGGLGSPVSLYLAAAGVGKLILIDQDKVELSNLQRQILYKVSHLGQSKVSAAAKTLQALNNQIEVHVVEQLLTSDNGDDLFCQVDLVLDCSDNFDTRYLVNALAKKHRIPLISGAAMQQQGQLAIFPNDSSLSPCYACLFPKVERESVQNCSTLGVMSPILGVIGSMQANAAINGLLGKSLDATFIQFNGETMAQQQFNLTQNKRCDVCQEQ